jgi:chromate transporter
LPYPLIVFGAALFGYLAFPNKDNFEPIAQKQLIHKTLITIIVWLIIWWAPILIIYLFFDYQFLTEIMIFFSKLAVVTFGGAYAVLAYMAQEVVSAKDWLTAGEMMDGLGLAETTPGPLILVTEFVGFIAGYKEGGIITAIIAAFLTLWVTFAPCFLWIFAGAPYIDWIGSKSRLHGALSGITAAVVGVILNLSTWFTLHVLFESVNLLEFGSITVLLPEISTLNITAAVLALFSAWLLLKQDWNIIWILIINALLAATISTF